MNGNGDNGQGAPTTPRMRQRATWPLIILAALFIIVPFFTWYGTWFGRELSDADVATYLADQNNPRHMQHALSQIAERIERHDSNVKNFYPQVIVLSKSPIGEIRKTTAWVMGQDNSSQEFHRALLALLTDNEPLVRRNAALQLVRFGDAAGRSELRAMLQSFEAKSPVDGAVVSLLAKGSKVRAGGLLARIRDASNNVQEFRSPVDGAIGDVAVKEGETIVAGQTLLWLRPDRATIDDALQALAYVGTRDDLPLIESCAQTDGSAETGEQAAFTAKAIEARLKTTQ